MKEYTAHKQFLAFLTVFLLFGLVGVLPADGSVSLQTGESLRKVVPAVVAKDRSVKLIGTAVCGNRKDSIAIVADKRSRRQWLLWEGGQLGPITIKNIKSDRVIIDTGKGLSEVKIRRNIINVAAQDAASYQDNSQPSNHVKNGPRNRFYQLDQEKVESASINIGETMASIITNPGRLFNQDKGLRIASIESGSIFANMGLHRGDLVLRVNSIEVADAGDLMSLIKNMQSDGKAGLTVRRRARTYNFSLQTH